MGAALLLLVILGHDGRRIAQLMALALPALAWLLWPVRRAWLRGLRAGLVWIWAMAFVFDGALRAYLLDAYQAAPDSAMVLGAAANTTARESAEYLSMHWRSLVIWSVALIAAGGVLARGALKGARATGSAWPRAAVGLLCVLLLPSAIAYASKPWRRLHPFMYWTQWTQSVQTLQAGWADQQQARERALHRAKAEQPVVVQSGPATVVLAISDSVNRDNLGLYGYGRATTPRLLDLQAQLRDQMLVLKNAWSVDASTLPALRSIFNFGLPESEDPPHALAVARTAGYKVWWISNHDDVAIEQKHARFADVVDLVNRTPGRASASLDGELLDSVQAALRDPAGRKLIVVHLMGAHPHYGLRFPEGGNPFDDRIDDVEAGLVKDGRSAWVRHFRQEYDAALLYHDFVVAELLQMTRQAGTADEYRAWMYLSDHGQEVGHESDRAGHSPSTASGYRIPTVIWRNRPDPPFRPGQAEHAFRADWAGWTLTDLLRIQWQGHRPSRNVLHTDYLWHAPDIPATVSSFTR